MGLSRTETAVLSGVTCRGSEFGVKGIHSITRAAVSFSSTPLNGSRVLFSTNLIENLFSRVREIGRRVRRWQSGTMVLRWTGARVLEPESGFRKLVSHRAMPILAAALRARDVRLDGDRRGVVDVVEKAA